MRNDGGMPVLVPEGTPYTHLVDDLANATSLQRFDFARAARIAPKALGGLNIEGLGATRSGGLLIGFRSPVPQGLALVVPLTNPAAVVHGARALLDEPILLDLGGLGIRSLDYRAVSNDYLIVAGGAGDGGTFRLYRWPGPPQTRVDVVPGVDFTDLQPETLVIYAAPHAGVQALSDDGARLQAGIYCKDAPVARQGFRSTS